MGKGCRYRPVDQKVYAENYDRIFGAKPQKEGNDDKVCNSISKNEEVVQDKVAEGSPQREVSTDPKGFSD